MNCPDFAVRRYTEASTLLDRDFGGFVDIDVASCTMAQELVESASVYWEPTVVEKLGSRLEYFGIQRPHIDIEVVTTYPTDAQIHRDSTAAHRREPECRRRVIGRREMAADNVRRDMPDDFVGTGVVALLLDVFGMSEYLNWY